MTEKVSAKYGHNDLLLMYYILSHTGQLTHIKSFNSVWDGDMIIRAEWIHSIEL